jgi:hypothetical protein
MPSDERESLANPGGPAAGSVLDKRAKQWLIGRKENK